MTSIVVFSNDSALEMIHHLLRMLTKYFIEMIPVLLQLFFFMLIFCFVKCSDKILLGHLKWWKSRKILMIMQDLLVNIEGINCRHQLAES